MKQIAVRSNFDLKPTTVEEAHKYANLLASSNLVPSEYKNKPTDVFIAMQMGAEVGLPPIQALQNIAVINGRPCMWGDALLALIKHHPEFEDIDEVCDGKIAKCTIRRKGQTPQVRTFSMDDARLARLDGRPTWKSYPKRMLQMRARGFCIRDTFPDALKGLFVREEVEDYSDQRMVRQERSDKANEIIQKLEIKKEDAEDAHYTDTVSVKAPVTDEDCQEFVDALTEEPTFKELLDICNVSQEQRQEWLIKGGVDDLDDLKQETKDAIINKLKSREK